MTGLRRWLADSFYNECLIYVSMAVLCAIDGCDHSTCHDGPFRAVFVGVEVGAERDEIATACVYSSETVAELGLTLSDVKRPN
jgi:hypothetical protein